MKVLKQVIFLSIGFLPAFSLMLVQAWWMIILCDEPVISSMDEFIPFLIYSLIILFLHLLIKKKKPAILAGIIMSGVFWSILWVVGLSDILSYQREYYLNLTIITGAGSIFVITLHSLYLLSKRLKEIGKPFLNRMSLGLYGCNWNLPLEGVIKIL
ncbi:hypothetical protein [Desulfotomaculum sp. 1211_IL3151]|uniref:hypothetical protein n=1 Tax=Desulfotomaculum sp. 1211_IL3151 TaxID=3084055 RepID=UPI002FD99CC7